MHVPGSGRRLVGIRTGGSMLAVAMLGAAISGCTTQASAPTGPPPVEVASFAGLVRLPDGRKIFAECSGKGTPTVVMVPGSRSWHDVWDSVEDRTTGKLMVSDASAFGRVAKVTRVCTYDRPGTSPKDASAKSTLVTQPTSAQQGADDLQAWLTAAKIPGPYVLVSHSWGGMITTMYAGSHPDQVAGLVYVDSATPNLQDALTPEQWATFTGALPKLVDGSGAEVPDYPASMDAVRAAAKNLPQVPTVVITADQQFDFGAGGAQTWPAWGQAQAEFAKEHNARHITETGSAHMIPLTQPQLVADAVIGVVQQARN